MSIFRSYLKKGNTLISSNNTNNSQNPVTEISYGTYNKQVSRFIFDVDFSELISRINDGFINENRIVKHVLHFTNTIRYADEYVGKKSYSLNIDRASSFELDLFNVDEDWDEGSGYEFIYDSKQLPISYNLNEGASNWDYRKNGTTWTNEGAYLSGSTEILASQHFQTGNENIEIDITQYVNDRLFNSGSTSNGLGIKFNEMLEDIESEFINAVAFHTHKTHTFYEPYIETIIDDTIIDDRNYFYLDKDNDLYFYMNVGRIPQNVTINSVTIYDNNDNEVTVLSGNSINNVSKGVYSINLNIDSSTYPDSVMFRDEWSYNINGKEFVYEGDFYLISNNSYYSNQNNTINFDNYYFYFWGISEKEKLSSNSIKKIKLTIKEFYPNQNNFIPLDIEYRIFTTVGSKYELDVVPFTKVNRTFNGYEFDLDTSWLIPQDYKLQIRLKDGNYYENKQTLSFSIQSNKIF